MAIKTYPKGSKEQLSKSFHAYEFDCPCSRCKQTPIDTELVEKLQIMRDLLGAPINPNAYRCPEHNAEIPNAAKASKHMQGMAADITVEGKKPAEVAKCAESVGFKGIGLYDGFVHVDTRPTKYFWYGHQQEYRSTFGGTAPAEESTSQSASKPVTTYSSVRLPILMRGSEGDSVKAMQILLKAYGYDLGKYGPNKDGIDGEFGAATQNAVEAFQEDNDLEVDGKFGPKSWGAALGL